MLNPFMHSVRQFKQQKIEILSKFTSPDSGQFVPENPKVRMFSQRQNKSGCTARLYIFTQEKTDPLLFY